MDCGIDFHVFHCRWRLLFEHDFDTFFPFVADRLLYRKSSAKCVLHNKNKGFYTFNVFGQIRFLMYFIDSDIDFAIHFLDGFYGTSKFLEV